MTKYVYLATCPDRYKIGYSGQVRERFSSLKTATKLPLELTAMIPGGKAVEAEVHGIFDDLRIEGEWFEPEERIVQWFKGHVNYINPGRPYYPNFTPERLIKKITGSAARSPDHEAKLPVEKWTW